MVQLTSKAVQQLMGEECSKKCTQKISGADPEFGKGGCTLLKRKRLKTKKKEKQNE